MKKTAERLLINFSVKLYVLRKIINFNFSHILLLVIFQYLFYVLPVRYHHIRCYFVRYHGYGHFYAVQQVLLSLNLVVPEALVQVDLPVDVLDEAKQVLNTVEPAAVPGYPQRFVMKPHLSNYFCGTVRRVSIVNQMRLHSVFNFGAINFLSK